MESEEDESGADLEDLSERVWCWRNGEQAWQIDRSR